MPYSAHNVTHDGFGRKYYDFDLRRVVSFVFASAIRLLAKLGFIDNKSKFKPVPRGADAPSGRGAAPRPGAAPPTPPPGEHTSPPTSQQPAVSLCDLVKVSF